MKHRLERVKELVKRELSEIIAREITFRAALVTVQSVDITPDLRNSFIYVSVIGSDAEKKSAVAKLEEKRVLLQQMLAKRVIIKYTPHMHFRLDDSVERGDRIIQILQDIEIPEDEELEPHDPDDLNDLHDFHEEK